MCSIISGLMKCKCMREVVSSCRVAFVYCFYDSRLRKSIMNRNDLSIALIATDSRACNRGLLLQTRVPKTSFFSLLSTPLTGAEVTSYIISCNKNGFHYYRYCAAIGAFFFFFYRTACLKNIFFFHVTVCDIFLNIDALDFFSSLFFYHRRPFFYLTSSFLPTLKLAWNEKKKPEFLNVTRKSVSKNDETRRQCWQSHRARIRTMKGRDQKESYREMTGARKGARGRRREVEIRGRGDRCTRLWRTWWLAPENRTGRH